MAFMTHLLPTPTMSLFHRHHYRASDRGSFDPQAIAIHFVANPYARPSLLLRKLPLHLFEPEAHVHLAVHRCCGSEVLPRLIAPARAPVELPKAEMAVGDEGAHAARLGQRQRLAVVDLAAFGIEPVGMGRDIAKQMQAKDREPGVTRRGFARAVAQAPRLVEPAEQETGAPQRVVIPTEIRDDFPRRLTLEELLAFPEPAQRLARFAKLRQRPGGGGDRPGKVEDDVPRPDHRDPVLER